MQTESNVMNSCLICHKKTFERSAPFLCKSCVQTLEPAKSHDEFYSLYRYNSILRELVLKVKIHDNFRAVACLNYLFVNSDLSSFLAKSCDFIIPAPSSLWSRLRGRIDLAWLLATALSKQYHCRIRAAPIGLHWQLSKRSKILHREKLKDVREAFFGEWKEKTCLIIDDVVTSGYTLRRVASRIKKENCKFLTLGSAFV